MRKMNQDLIKKDSLKTQIFIQLSGGMLRFQIIMQELVKWHRWS